MSPQYEVTRRGLLQAGGLLSAALFLGSCSSSGGKTPAGGGGSTSAAQASTEQELEDASKKEGGKGLFYINGDLTLAQSLKKGFEKAYPWTNVTSDYLATTTMPNKMITEKATHAPTCDVFMLPQTFRQALLKNDIPAPVNIAAESALPADLLDQQHYCHPCYELLLGVIYNTNLIKEPDLPKSIQDFADPAWKGKIAFDSPENTGQAATWLGAQAHTLGQSRWMTWLDGLKSNSIFITTSGGDTYTAVLRGERPIGLGGSSNDTSTQAKGAPVAANWLSYPPVPFAQNLWMNKRASNPATGQLFINWVLSQDGQQLMASTGRSPVLRSIVSPIAISSILPAGASVLPGTDMVDFYNNTKTYLDAMDSRWPA